uniref:Deoxyuridine 5'-triphosphate nucleotidohydrolase n=1 Tax=Geotrypetes seraphini TaxID=260995 RepID=A0A6P8RU10_GEOSA|nr:deoxyuridine 5'-triphosphate nucleotidohydrolase-like [Geotrypetes seraphini]
MGGDAEVSDPKTRTKNRSVLTVHMGANEAAGEKAKAQFYWHSLPQEVKIWYHECKPCHSRPVPREQSDGIRDQEERERVVDLGLVEKGSCEVRLKFVRLSNRARSPYKATSQAAGFDLSSAQERIIPKGGREVINTDLQVSLPPGCYGRIAPRSGLALRHGLCVGAGVVDPDYRGPLKILLFNLGEEDYRIREGDRIAQLICEKVFLPDLQEEERLEETDRGNQGWGSTGVDEAQTWGKQNMDILSRLEEGVEPLPKDKRTDSVLRGGGM